MSGRRVISRAIILGIAAALAVSASSLQAQRRGRGRPVEQGPTTEFGVDVGGTFPLGDFGDFAGTGWHAGVLLGVLSPYNQLGFRVDGTYHGLGSVEYTSGVATLRDKPSIIAGTANLMWHFMPAPGSGIRPYVLGGLGIYDMRVTTECISRCGFGDVTDSEAKFGINGGGGLEFALSGLSAFVEARFHNVFGGVNPGTTGERSAQFIPISFGLLFR